MIRRAIVASVAVLSLALVAPTTAQSQSLYVLAGLSIPSSDYGDFYGTGWHAAGGVTFPVGTAGLRVGAEGLYGQHGSDFDSEGADVEDGKVWSVMGLVEYDFPTEGVISPYVWGGLGVMGLDAGSSESGFGWQFGGGIAFDQGSSLTPFVEGRYQSASIEDVTVAIFGVEAGVAFGI